MQVIIDSTGTETQQIFSRMFVMGKSFEESSLLLMNENEIAAVNAETRRK